MGTRSPRLASFPRDGGWIRVGAEVMRYDTFDGSTFRGCERGALAETPLRDNGSGRRSQGRHAGHRLHGLQDRHAPRGRTPRLPDLVRQPRGSALHRRAGARGPGCRPSRLDQIRPFLTVWSRRETASGLAGPAGHRERAPASRPTRPRPTRCRSWTSSTRTAPPPTSTRAPSLRITDGTSTVYQTVDHVGDMEDRQPWRYVTLAGRVDATAGEEGLTFEGARPGPRRSRPSPSTSTRRPLEVIYACLANLQAADRRGPGADRHAGARLGAGRAHRRRAKPRAA